jgi:hypothetical protein
MGTEERWFIRLLVNEEDGQGYLCPLTSGALYVLTLVFDSQFSGFIIKLAVQGPKSYI